MKLKYLTGIIIACVSLFTSCADFTEIDAKGNNLLSSVTDLELLLNGSYGYDMNAGVEMLVTDFEELCGDYIYTRSTLASLITGTAQTASSIRLNWDEQAWVNDLPELTNVDMFYNGCYYYIGAIANPILLKVDGCTGDQSKKNAVKAEAYLLRAYFHYLAAQRFAPAYDPATASSTTAICYITEDMDIKTPSRPLSMEQYYQKILADVQAAIDLDAIPIHQNTRMRMNKPAAYAVKALALLSMQRFDQAAEAAAEALAIDNTVNNYNDMLQETTIVDATGTRIPYKSFLRPINDVEEDYFTTFGYSGNDNITPYAQTFFEEGHVYKYYLSTRQLGMSTDEADAISESVLGEKGYLITDDDSNHPRMGLRSTQMYLILAEASIHNGQYDQAMGYLDKIRENRIVPEQYAPLEGTNPDKADAIKYLKMSAETEGLFSIWNFINRKRWNALDNDFKETITRTIAGVNMTISPNSKLWVFPIPMNVCASNSNLKPYLNW